MDTRKGDVTGGEIRVEQIPVRTDPEEYADCRETEGGEENEYGEPDHGYEAPLVGDNERCKSSQQLPATQSSLNARIAMLENAVE